ncbi:hypothetical protein [Klebsiella pneumoniae]|uniref:hypothetical protein n=1 Tax=Klebsiella pneumoniae TaxID=573 RepID=UPI00131B9C8B|nr:hypothetical protein [Klebsiella pneumoniae]
MSEQITGSTPRIYYRGTKDSSVTRSTGSTTTLPLHRPLIMFFGQKGPTVPTWIDPVKFEDIYGSETTNLSGVYCTHSTPFIKEAIAAGNQFMALRLEPSDIPDVATLGLSVDWVKTKIDDYERNDDGTYKLDTNGDKIPLATQIDGIKFRFVLEKIETNESGVSQYKKRTAKAGTIGTEATPSTITPLADFRCRFKSSLGANTALRIWAPTINSAQAADADLQARIKSFLYRFQILTRADKASSPTIFETIYNEPSLSVGFGENLVDPQTEVVYDFVERIDSRYNDEDPSTYLMSPLDTPYLYQANIDTVLTAIQELEAPFDTVSADEDDLYQINLFGAQTVEGVPYHAVQILGVLDGGVTLTETATNYLQGGGDGTLGNDSFNAAAYAVLSNLSNNAAFNITNYARYPFNAFWDSGFDLKTKQTIPQLIGLRADTWIALSTQDISLDFNSNEEEESIALSLMSRVSAFPDSSDFGTPAFRGMIVGGAGYYTETTRKLPVPLTLDRFRAYCRYAGASDGVLKPEYAVDEGDARKVQVVKSINNLDKSWRVRRAQWNNNLVYVEDYDTNSQFYPGQQSFYSEQGSVLKAAIVGLCVANLNRFAFEAWRDLTGTQKLTDDQLIERSDDAVSTRGTGAFDDRLIFTPHSEITQADKERGYSWSMRIDFGANAFRTVMDMSSVAYTREELANG